MDSKQIDPKVMRAARSFKQAVAKAGIQFEEIMLFGSQTKGKAGKHSDIDICLITRDLPNDGVANFVRLRRISRQIDIDIEPHTLHPDDFTNKYSAFAQEVRKFGIPI